MRNEGYLEWILIILAVIMLLLGVIAWQFVGDDIARGWDNFWWEHSDRVWWRVLLGVSALVFYGACSWLWRAIFPPREQRDNDRT